MRLFAREGRIIYALIRRAGEARCKVGGFGRLEGRFDALGQEMNGRFGQVDQRFEATNQQIAGVRQEMNGRFEQVDQRFDQVLQQLATITMKLDQGR